MFRLTTLGDLALVSATGSGDGPALHRQKLAVLAVLALSDRPLSRDALVGYFWADQEEGRARHSLSNALSSLRGLLGPGAIRRHRGEVALEPGVPLTVDARELANAVAAGDWERAVGLYGGPFLDAIYVGGSPAFEQWVDGERARLEGLFLTAAGGRCRALADAGRWDECADLARRWLVAAPLSSEAAAALLDALTAPGTRDGDHRALEAYDRLTTLLGEEYHRRPDREVIRRAREIVERLRAGDATAEYPVPAALLARAAAHRELHEPVADYEPPSAPSPVGAAAGPSRRRRWLAPGVLRALAAALLGVLLLPPLAARLRTRPPGLPSAVAIGMIRAPGDSASAWLGDGLVQMISGRLARIRNVEVVAPERMRELLPRGGGLSDLLEAARRAQARWVVSGAVTRAERGLLLDVNVHDATDGRLVSLATVAADDPIALAALAAARILTATGAATDGAALAEVETQSPEAFEHYVRFTRLADEGRGAAAVEALDAAIAVDSGFVTALRERAMIAFDQGPREILPVLLDAFRRNEARATEYDRTFLASQAAFYAGEHGRAATLARDLAHRHPRDPRVRAWLVDVLILHGQWDEAEAELRGLLALDSLATRSGAAVCVPCRAYSRFANLHHLTGNLAGAEHAARRLTTLAPGLGSGWDHLATVLGAQGRFDEALAAVARSRAIDRVETRGPSLQGRLLLMARRWAEAESLVRDLPRSEPALRDLALDLSAMLSRERGRFRAAVAALDSMSGGLELLAAATRAAIGDHAGARRAFAAVHPPGPDLTAGPALRVTPRTGDAARAFAWARAIEADAIAPTGDTLRLRRIADSLQLVAGVSYYARDWRLQHHVRGLLLARAGRDEDAAAEFRAARWGHLGWGRPLVEEARALLRLGRPDEAVAALRVAYAVPPDAMGRYVARSELDLHMARAHRAAGRADSAARYEAWVRAAWVEADPEIRRLLDQP